MLENLSRMRYSFVSKAPTLAPDTFAVVSFTGQEAFSEPYTFDLVLVSENGEIDLDAVVQQKAVFTVHRSEGDDVPYHGLVVQFSLERKFNRYYFYRATLVPRFWWLSLTRHNQVFLDKDVKGMVEDVLKDGGLTSQDYDFRLQGEYPGYSFVCQYNESHKSFIHRWIEREGIYYFFEQTDAGEKIVFTDAKISHVAMPQGAAVIYSPPSGLASRHRDEVVSRFAWKSRLLPSTVRLLDYNYETPSLDLTQEAPVDSDGFGEMITYGEHYKTPDEGGRLAKIRAEALNCRKNTYTGESSVPFIRPGYTFTMQDHDRDELNRQFLTTRLEMAGDQTGFLVSGIREGLTEREQQPYYRNTFTAIESDRQFRTECVTPKPRIDGVLQAHIDAAASGQYAELDEQGRYKIVLPFDLSGRKDGKASCYLRMAQPYTGANHGMHFPLHKGTEVLLSFTDGDPDRPIILGAVNNPSTASLVKGENQTKSVIQTGNKSQMHFEDKEGSERMQMHVPAKDAFVRIGAPNDPPSSEGGDAEPPLWNLVDEDGIKITAGLNLNIYAGLSNEIILINNLMGCLGFEQKIFIKGEIGVLLGYKGAWGITSSYAGLHKLGLGGVKSHIKAMENEINELKTKVQQAEEKAAATKQNVSGVKSRITEQKSAVNGERVLLAGAKQSVKEIKDSLNGEISEINTLHTKVAQEEIKAAGSLLSTNMIRDSVKEMDQSVTAQGAKAQALKQETFELAFESQVNCVRASTLIEQA